MSTKAIRELAQWVKDEYGGIIEEMADKALFEVEAIERAAKEWADVEGQPGPGRMQRLDVILRSIAKDAP